MANTPGATDREPDSGYQRLEEQIRWYDTKSGSSQWWYKRTKLLEIMCAAAVPIVSFYCPAATAILGAAILVLEALQQLNQWQHTWITYRSTCEDLRHEKYAYLGSTGDYDIADDVSRKKVLVDRVEALISTEHSKWISQQQRVLTRAKAPAP